jgi:glycosyltransferase involved in cell wall biosynthesis
LQSQSLKDIEIVAVNDGSTDSSLKKLKQLSKKDKRIKIVNNDRNHGLLYSRAMGIINSTGQYLMNLDPDDKLVSSNNLKLLYKTMTSKNLDLIVYKIKRIALNKTEKILYKYIDDNQFKVLDDHITNKLIKKNVFLKAYDEFKDEIFSHKWNFHEDNIWSILVKNFSNSSALLNQFVYSYKRNEESLNMQKGNINDIKSTFYRLKKMIKFNNTNINKFIYHFRRMIESYPVLKDYEIKNMIVKLSVQYRHLFKKNSKTYKIINCALNMISEKKIIIFNESEEDQLIKSNKTHTFNFLKKYNGKKFIFIESNSKSVLEYIKNYIFSNDIIVLFNGKINKDYMRNIINFHDKNKVIVF